mmetsp:Transcript_57177/g.134556  ORF Transcript_57177/g.134556 Transcript_57177/m.134556 type:complete len:253 (-) Transcript_57177:187-945(-)
MAVPKSDTWEGSVEMPKPENGSHAEEVQEGSVAISIAKPEGSTTLSPTKGEGRAGTAASGHLENAHDGATLNPDIPAQEAGRKPGQPLAKVALIGMVALFVLLVISGAAARVETVERPWLTKAGQSSAAYFSAGTVSAGVISASSSLGIGMVSVGMVSVGVVGSVGIFSVGFFSIGFFSIGVFSLGHVALGVYAYGAYSRWMQGGEGWSDGAKVTLQSARDAPQKEHPVPEGTLSPMMQDKSFEATNLSVEP